MGVAEENASGREKRREIGEWQGLQRGGEWLRKKERWREEIQSKDGRKEQRECDRMDG